MKRFICFMLACTLLFSGLSIGAFASGESSKNAGNTEETTDAMPAIREAFSAYHVGESASLSEDEITLASELYPHLPVTITVYNDPSAKPTSVSREDAIRLDATTEPNPNNPYRSTVDPSGRPFILYVVNTSVGRIGTSSDVEIIADLLAKGYLVAVLDYHNDSRAVSPNLDWNIQFIRMAMTESGRWLGGVKVWNYYNYVVPAGYTISRGVQYYNYRENAPAEVMDVIVDYWNSDGFRSYFGNRIIVWPEGQKVTEDAVWSDEANRKIAIKYTIAEKVEDCVKADGSPIDLNLYLDIVYPTGGVEVPVACLHSSSETRSDANTIANRPHMTGFLFSGYAGVVYDHPYTPMSREDHYGYYQGTGGMRNVFTLGYYTYASAQQSVIRCLRYLSDKYDEYNFKEDGYGAWGHSKGAWVNMLGTEETELVHEHYQVQGEGAVVQSVAWKKYDNGDPISSSIQLVYTSNGGGDANLYPDMAPTVVTQGEADGLFDSWSTHYFNILSYLKEHDIPSLGMTMPGVGHTTIHGYSQKYDFDMYRALFRFADYYLKDDATECLYITPINGTEEVATDSPITLKFTGPVTEAEISKVTVQSSSGEIAVGTWSSAYGNTEWTFTPSGLLGGRIYTVRIPDTMKGENGKPIAAEKSVFFRTVHETKAEGAITSPSSTLTKTETTANGVYMLFENINASSSVGAQLRFTVSSDAVNTVSVYAVSVSDARNNNPNPVLGEKLATIKVNGAGQYDADISDYIEGKADGADYAFYLTAERVTGNFTYAFLDFDTCGASPTQNINSKIVTSPTDPTDKVRYLTGSSTLLNSILMAGITEEDLGRRLVISLDCMSPISRTMVIGISDHKEAGTAWTDWTNNNRAVAPLPAGQWVTMGFTFNITDPDYVTYKYYSVSLQHEGSLIGDSNGFKYIDDLKIVEIVTDVPILEETNETGIGPCLILHPTSSVVLEPTDFAYVESGENGDTVMPKGDTCYIGARTSLPNEKKVYARFDLSKLDTKHTALISLHVDSETKGKILIYGIADIDLSSSWSPETLTYQNAPAAIPYVMGADLTKVIWGAPIAEAEINGEGDYAINVTEYLYLMKEKTSEEDKTTRYSTLLLVADPENTGEITFSFNKGEGTTVSADTIVTTIDFDSYTTFNFAKKRGENSYGVTDVYMQGNYNEGSVSLDDTVFDGKGETGKSVKIGGTTTGGYNVYKFWKILPVFTETDLGNEYTLTFRMRVDKAQDIGLLLSTCGYTSYSAQNASQATFQRKDIKKENLVANEWTDVTYSFTVTSEMIGNPPSDITADTRPVLFTICTNYTYGTNIWVDNFKLVKHAKSDSTAPDFYRHRVDFEDKKMPNINGLSTSQRGISETENTTYGGSSSLWASIQVTYGRILIGNVLNSTNTISDSDIGAKYTISFKYKVSKAGSFIVSLANADTATDTSQNPWLKQVKVTDAMVNQWNTYTYEVIITEDMKTPKTSKGVVTTTPAYCLSLFLNGFGTSGADFYLDDILSYRNYSDVGTLTSPDDSRTTNAAGVTETLSLLGEDPATGVNKTYLRFTGENLSNVKRVLLRVSLSGADGELLSLWGMKKSKTSDFPTSLTYNNAPGSTVGEGIDPALVYGEAALGFATAINGTVVFDVTDYILAEGIDGSVFILTTSDGGGKKITVSSPSLTVERIFTVTVTDGEKETSELCDGNYTLPTGLWLSEDGTVKNGGETVQLESDATFTKLFPTLLPGASVRTESPAGLRFTAEISAQAVDSLKTAKADFTLGILVAPTDRLTVDFTKAALDSAGIAYSEMTTHFKNGTAKGGVYTLHASVTNILSQNYARKFSAVAYLRVGDVFVYSDYNEADNARSILQVASAAYNDRMIAKTETTEASLLSAPNGAKTIVSLMIDDTGNIDTVEWLNEMAKQYGVKGSATVIAGQLTPAITARYKAVFEDGNIDPANHSYSHTVIPAVYWTTRQKPAWTSEQIAAADTLSNYVHEFDDSLVLLSEQFPGYDILGFAASNNTLSDGAAEYLRSRYYAIRCGASGIQLASKTYPNIWTPGVNDATETTSNGSATFGSWQNLSVVSLRLEKEYESGGKTAGELDMAIIDRYIAAANENGESSWFIGWTHAITESYDRAEAEKLFTYVKTLTDNGTLANLSFTNAIKYLREYQNTTLVSETNGDGIIRITPTMSASTSEGLSLTKSVFNYPLSVSVKVPETWREVTFSQVNGTSGKAKVVSQNGGAYATITLLPGEGVLTVSETASPAYSNLIDGAYSPYSNEQLAIMKEYLDSVVVVNCDGTVATLETGLYYTSPYTVSVVDNQLKVSFTDIAKQMTTGTIKTVVLNGTIYTGGWNVASGMLTAKLP